MIMQWEKKIKRMVSIDFFPQNKHTPTLDGTMKIICRLSINMNWMDVNIDLRITTLHWAQHL